MGNLVRIKILPVIQLLIAASGMFLIEEMVSIGYFDWGWSLLLSWVLVAIGTVFVLMGGAAFLKADTTVNPLHPENASALVTSGIYRFSRNPMYLGCLLMLLALGLYLKSIPSFIMLPLFCWYITKTQIYAEEQALEKRFGESYRSYKLSVRRWV